MGNEEIRQSPEDCEAEKLAKIERLREQGAEVLKAAGYVKLSGLIVLSRLIMTEASKIPEYASMTEDEFLSTNGAKIINDRLIMEAKEGKLPPEIKDELFNALVDIMGDKSPLNEQVSDNSILGAEQATIEMLKSAIPRTHIKPNNLLSNEITKDFINEGEIKLRIGETKAKVKRDIITKAILTYESENISLSGRVKYSSYDREVYDGVVTLFEAGNTIITPTLVYRAMNGMTETEYISPQAVGAVTRSLDKAGKTTLKIDFSQEAQAYKKDCKAFYEGYLLAYDKITVKTGGKEQIAYRLLRKPILYEYAQVTGQIISVPIELLKTYGAVRNTEEVIVIRGYLLRQIAGMKSPKFKRNNRIAFEGIYDELDMRELTAKAFSDRSLKVRNHVATLLTEWVEQKFIKSFEIYKEGKTHKGVAITL